MRPAPRALAVTRRADTFVAVLLVACSQHENCIPGTSRPAQTAQATADATSFVLAFSLTGRTRLVANELADATGARAMIIPLSPPGSPPRPASVPALHGVRRLYLGFPIWANAPVPEVLASLSGLNLRSVEVVPFFSYLHYVSPEALARFTTALQEKGAIVRPPLAFRVSFSVSPEALRRRVARALITRRDLWPDETPPAIDCRRREGPSQREVCTVPRGYVWMGDNAASDSPEGAALPRRVWVDGFALDREEVKISDYLRCVSVGKCPRVSATRDGMCHTLFSDGPDRPMPCVGLREARAWCAFAGGYVPTETQWIRAARGSSTRAYPWGDDSPRELTPLRGNFGERPSTGLREYSLVDESSPWPRDGFARLSPSCFFTAGVGPFGHCDLSGNLSEWATGPNETTVLKGGSWLDEDLAALRIGTRAVLSLDDRVSPMGFYLTGVRCAYPLETQ